MFPVVKSDWGRHAVAYVDLKRALSENHTDAAPPPSVNSNRDDIGICGSVGENSDCWVNGVIDSGRIGMNINDDDAHSIHTESSYHISDAQIANFFRIYQDSVRRLTKFYVGQVQWANEERGKLDKTVEKLIAEDGKLEADNDSNMNERLQHLEEFKAEDGSSSSTSFLIHQINNFSRDLGLALDFFELNTTAFSNIMKKFDRCTGFNLRETKLRELKKQHPYLYDGGQLKKYKNMCASWIDKLQAILQQDSKAFIRSNGRFSGNYRRSSSSRPGVRLGLSLANSLITVDKDKVSKLAQTIEKAIDADKGGENPQESSEMMKEKGHAPRKEPNVRFEGGCNKNPAPRSIRRTKESTILEKMIDRVNEELCLQKADSPFFDKALELELTATPSFTNSEVELAEALGEGEFCKVYEVRQFHVPESCHICFLHTGFKDPNSSMIMGPSVSTDNATLHRKVPGTAVANNANNCSSVCADGEAKPAAACKEQSFVAATNQTKSTSSKPPKTVTGPNPRPNFSFCYDANISDYEELESDHQDEHHDYGHNTTRGFMKDHCLRDGEARYAIKRIRSSMIGHEEITDAAIDLAREAEFLAALKHPNIIRIRGTINVPGHPKYSLVLDRLYDTLDVQMKKWKAIKKQNRGKFKGLIGKNGMMLSKLWMDQLVASYDLARAMAYLHSRGILHRDIKPANIGFDIRGDIKIFDFGLAKELKPCDQEGDDKYRTDGLAGTRRYMAPEVAQVMPYGLSSDVYSFGILLWEMLSLKNAFETHTREKHYKDVIVEGNRPKLSKSWPFVIRDLVERCWHKRPSERPTFQSVCELIKFGMTGFKLDASGRSAELMLRSYRSTHGHDNM